MAESQSFAVDESLGDDELPRKEIYRLRDFHPMCGLVLGRGKCWMRAGPGAKGDFCQLGVKHLKKFENFSGKFAALW